MTKSITLDIYNIDIWFVVKFSKRKIFFFLFFPFCFSAEKQRNYDNFSCETHPHQKLVFWKLCEICCRVVKGDKCQRHNNEKLKTLILLVKKSSPYFLWWFFRCWWKNERKKENNWKETGPGMGKTKLNLIYTYQTAAALTEIIDFNSCRINVKSHKYHFNN